MIHFINNYVDKCMMAREGDSERRNLNISSIP